MSKDTESRFLGSLYGHGTGYAGAVWDTESVCPTLNTMQGGRQPHIVEVARLEKPMNNTVALRMVRTEEGKKLRKAYEAHEVHHGFNEHREAEPRTDGLCNTISTVQKDNYLLETGTVEDVPDVFQRFVYEIDGELYLIRIRKLTPLECWRLMGFTDADFEKAASVVSNTQLYKQAGNSIVKQVLMQVFSQMLTKQTRVSGLQRKALALLDML